MTVCIAAVCADGQKVVVASDRMVSAGFLALEFEHPNAKMQTLSETCVGLTAGDALAHTELFRACRVRVQRLQAPGLELIANQVKDEFGTLRRTRAEDSILRPRGLTLEMFYQQGLMRHLPVEIALTLDSQIQSAKFPLEIIIAGVDTSGAHIYGVHDPGVVECYDSLSYHAIGSGSRHALMTLIGHEHSSDRSVNDTVYSVYEAKKRAEVAQGVGEATEIGIVTDSETRILTDEQKQALEGIYRKTSVPETDKVWQLVHQLGFEGEQT